MKDVLLLTFLILLIIVLFASLFVMTGADYGSKKLGAWACKHNIGHRPPNGLAGICERCHRKTWPSWWSDCSDWNSDDPFEEPRCSHGGRWSHEEYGR